MENQKIMKTIKKKVTVEKEVEVDLPCIVKSSGEKYFYKVVDENEVLCVSNFGSHITIEASDLVTLAFCNTHFPSSEEFNEANEAFNKVLREIKEKFNEKQ